MKVAADAKRKADTAAADEAAAKKKKTAADAAAQLKKEDLVSNAFYRFTFLWVYVKP